MSERVIFERKEDEKTIRLIGKEGGDLEIHIDGAWGLQFVNGICKVTFFTNAPLESENAERREVAVRLSMGFPTLLALSDYLARQCELLREKGIVLEEVTSTPSVEAEEAP